MFQNKRNRKEVDQNFIDEAGSATQIPPPPKGGIPKQRLPQWIRWPICVILLPFVYLDLFAQKIVKKIIRSPFKQVGECYKRGNCCHYILIAEPTNWLKKLHLLWSTEVNGFFVRGKTPLDYEGRRVIVMGCRYLKEDGTCSNYRLRPMVCRKWPLIEYFGLPQRLKGCGFRAVPRKPPKAKKPFSVHPPSNKSTNDNNKLRVIQ